MVDGIESSELSRAADTRLPLYGQELLPCGGTTQGNRLASVVSTKPDWILEPVTVEGSMSQA